MINLAGKEDCDKYIQDELERAGIEVVGVGPSRGEVPYTLEGRLSTRHGTFTFSRAWYYWCVSGNLPLEIAQKLYAHPEGRKTVRVAGHCGCPPPEHWITWVHIGSGKEALLASKYAEYKRTYNDSDSMSKVVKDMADKYEIVDSFAPTCRPFITSYHIDDQAGLLLFVMKATELPRYKSPEEEWSDQFKRLAEALGYEIVSKIPSNPCGEVPLGPPLKCHGEK